MTDYPTALAAAREAHTYVKHLGMTRAEAALGDLLAALDAARGEAVAWLDEFGNAYPLAAYSGKGDWRDDHKRYWRRAYAAPPAAAVSEPVGAMFRHKQSNRTRLVLEDEADDFEEMNATWTRVGAVCLCAASKENQ